MTGKKRVVVVASNYGVWGEELQAPWDIIKQAGHQVTIATPRGKKPLPLTISVDPDFVDPVQKYNVNPPEVCARIKELTMSEDWSNPVLIADINVADYDAIVLAGGLGADLDLLNNPALHRVILRAIRANKLVAAMCFAVGALVTTRDPDNGHKSVIYGKNVTAHPREWDFKDDASYELWQATPDNKGTDLVTPGFVVPLQDLVEDAVGPNGHVYSDPATSRTAPSVVFDWPFITATSVESSIAFGNKIVEVLETL